VQTALASLRRPTVRIALFVLAVVVVLSLAELTSERFRAFTQDHSLVSTFITEAVLLVGVYLVIDEIIERRQTRRWSDVTALGIRALSTRAEGPAGIVRRTVDQLAGGGPPDYREFIAGRSDELADWLRADGARSRSFVEEMRQSATRLEDAIIRWGPTLVEDPDSAELLNLMPDIVDSARAAADTIASAGTRGWADGDRRRFEESLLDILKNEEAFDRRAST
jgi:hypothetical protein